MSASMTEQNICPTTCWGRRPPSSEAALSGRYGRRRDQSCSSTTFDPRPRTHSPIGRSGGGRKSMGQSEFDPVANRRPWNAGRKFGAKRALKPRQVWAVRFRLDNDRRFRDRAMFDLAIDSKLRGCDLVKMKVGDPVVGGRVRARAVVVQQKTGRPVQFALLNCARTGSSFQPLSNDEAGRFFPNQLTAASFARGQASHLRRDIGARARSLWRSLQGL